ncbi:hypothetical protein J2X65_003503 [Ancylobacter sp. 3268]|uniref:hypothetical protein n=1 Tax=Ancylobacter sp. 3268 TaxID=2817752 RepID=UPI0028618629|nr:hypothetical protein [Ancylobacter sp. 3268]MDR6954135.1 hypothetical protein [Ancylobacter sp. 3268]
MVTKRKPADVRRDDLSGISLSSQGMAKHLGIKTRWLQQLVKEGTIPAIGRGQFDPDMATAAYCEFLRASAEKKVATGSVDDWHTERALDFRMKRLQKEGELIPLDLADAVTQGLIADFITWLQGLPAEISSTPAERQRLNGIIDKGRLRLADRAAKRQQALRVGNSAMAAQAPEDAA